MAALKYLGILEPGVPSILCLAGSMTSPCVYSQIEAPKGWQLVAIDYFRSPGPWDVDTVGSRVLELIRELELGPTILAGYSAGGVIAMAAATQDPNAIAGLMLSNTGPNAKGQGDPAFPQKLLAHWGEKAFTDNFLARCFSRPIPPVLKAQLLEYIGEIDKNAVYQVSQSLREVDYSEALKQVACPVMIAHGKEDKTRTKEHVEMLAKAMPQAQIHFLEGGHTIVVENKTQWQAALCSLAAEIERPAL